MNKILKAGKLELWKKYCETEKAKHELSYLFWECSLRCNLSCQHCGSSCGPNNINAEELNTEEIKNAFKTIAEDFDAKKITIAVTGGEPLLRRDLFEVMGYAHQLGFSWGMVTNGTMVSPEVIEQMKKAGMSVVSVSLDGTEANHNWLRNGRSVYARAMNGIKLLVAEKQFEVEALTCVNQNNFGELDEIHRLLKGLGVPKWRMINISPIGRAKDNPKLFLDARQWRELMEYIKNNRRDKNNLPIASYCDEGFLGPDLEGEVRNQLFYCWAGIRVGGILFNGDIAACPILPREHVSQGNVRQERFSRVWNDKYGMFRDRTWRKCGDCEDCGFWELCEGNSLHLWNFDEKKLMRCNYELMNDKDADRP